VHNSSLVFHIVISLNVPKPNPSSRADNLNTMRLLIPDATLTNRDNAVAKPAFNPHAPNEPVFGTRK
jgi:hypothetical protein